MLWSTIQGITRGGKGVQVAPLATDAFAAQREQVQAIRDAYGASEVGKLAEVMILSNRGVLMHVRCQEAPVSPSAEPSASAGGDGAAKAVPEAKGARKRRARA